MRTWLAAAVVFAVLVAGDAHAGTGDAVSGTKADAGASGKSAWQELVCKSGGFSVKMPGSPKESTETYDTDGGKVPATLYMLELEGGSVAYLAGYNDFTTDQVTGRDSMEMLDGAREGMLKNVKGTLVREKKISIGGHPGRELEVDAPGEMVVFVRVFLANKRLIQMLVVMPRAALASEDIKTFFGSFRLIATDAE
jgi:hypothetical protein